MPFPKTPIEGFNGQLAEHSMFFQRVICLYQLLSAALYSLSRKVNVLCCWTARTDCSSSLFQQNGFIVQFIVIHMKLSG